MGRLVSLQACLILSAAGLSAQPNRGVLAYSTYLGGGSVDIATAVATDARGNVYLAGKTVSANFPVTSGAFQSRQAGVASQIFLIGAGMISDAFVAKLDPLGKLVYSTYLGGSGTDAANAIAVDSQGQVYVAGVTGSADFPVTAGAFQTSAAFVVGGLAQTHIFVAKLNASGSGLVYSTLIAGSGSEDARGIAIDSAGNTYITGRTSSLDFPVTSGAFQTTAAKSTGFTIVSHGYVAKLNAAGSALIYATYLSGSNGAQANAIALGANGEAIVTGQTTSPDFPATPGAQQRTFAGQAAFVSRLDAAGAALVYSTFLGGDLTAANAIALDTSGAAYVAGSTSLRGFPVTPGAFQTRLQGSSAGFVAKLNPSGGALAYATLLGAGATTPYAISIDSSGNAWVAGETFDGNFPLTADAYQAGYNTAPCSFSISTPFDSRTIALNCGDAFLSELDPAGAKLLYSTYFGGNGYDQANALALAADGSVYLAGGTRSANLPATAGAISTHRSKGGGCTDWSSPTAQSGFPCDDAFVARFNRASQPALRPFEVVNAASLLPGAVAPGEIVSLLGSGIGPATPADLTLDSNGLVSTTLGGVRVLFDATPAPLIHVDSSHITLVVPYDSGGKQQARVAIEINGAAGPGLVIQIASAAPAVAPGIFTLTSDGLAACLNQDGSVNSPDNPAAAGSIVAIYLTGLGGTIPPSVDGTVTSLSALPKLAANILVYAGRQPADIFYAGPAPFLVSGVMQVNFRLPAVSGNTPVFVAAGDVVASQPGVWIAVR